MDELLQELKKSIAEATSKYVYKFDSETKALKMRKPNYYELKKWLKGILEYHYAFHKVSDDLDAEDLWAPMTRETYYSLKGMIRHGNFVPVLNYLKKRGHQDIMSNFHDYANTPSITDVKLQFSNPRARSSVCTIDIKLHG